MQTIKRQHTTKFIFVTGGVVSSLGKGIAAASVGRLFVERGLRVTMMRFGPYLNVDPGTMSPFQHGEVFVTDDGAETDLDLGHYERFIDRALSQANNVTTGRIYLNVITKERRGEFLGATVQVIPHITDEIKGAIRRLSPETDVVIGEVGAVIESPDVRTIYEIPLKFHEQRFDEKVLQKFGIERPAPALAQWRELVQRVLVPHERVRIAVVGKYTDYADSYKSVQEALIHGGIANDVGVDIQWMSSDTFSSAERAEQILRTVDGLLVPGGFGVRGVEGMVEA